MLDWIDPQEGGRSERLNASVAALTMKFQHGVFEFHDSVLRRNIDV